MNKLCVITGANSGIGKATALTLADKGAYIIIYLATSYELEDKNGKYFENRKVVRPAAVAYDEDKCQKLWEKSEELCEL